MLKPATFLVPAAAALCLILGPACDSESKTIKIATQTPLSGNQSAVGVDIKNAVQLAIDQLSEPIRKRGYKIELAPFDDQANPDTGVANAKAIVADHAVLGIIGHYNSGVQIPSSEEYHAANLCNISPANTNPKVTDRRYFEVNRVCGRDDVQGAVGAEFAKQQGIKTVYVVHDKGAYGQGIAEYFQKEAESRGVKVVGLTGTDETMNFESILAPVLNQKPEAVFFGGMFDRGALFYKQMREKGYKGLFLTDDGFDSVDTPKIAGKTLLEGAGVYFSSTTGPANAYPNCGKFRQEFKAKFGGDPQPNAAQAYDCASLMLKGIEDAFQAGNGKLPSRASICKAVRSLSNFHGLTGDFTFDEKGDPTVSKYFIIQAITSDPQKWADNKVHKTLEIAPPK